MDPYHDGLIHHSPVADPEALPGQPSPFYRAAYEQKEAPADLERTLPEPPKTIFGMRKITFFLLVVIVLLIIVGAIGGGVGGSLAVQNARKSSTSDSPLPSTVTATVTITASGPARPTESKSTAPDLHCPENDNTLYTAANGGQFVVSCNKDTPGNDLEISNTTSTLNMCIENCAYFNRQNPTVRCVGVVLGPFESNCWLKSDFSPSVNTTNKWIAKLQG